MTIASRWWRDRRAWIELYATANLTGLAVDIALAHSMNSFAARAEYIPLALSLAAPALLVPAMVLLARGRPRAWRWLGYAVGVASVAVGVAGLMLHLESRFFHDRTLISLVYAAPFAAPLAYTGLGLLLIMNRMVGADSPDWPRWVVLLALGGFVGNFVFTLTDHAQNGFFARIEWLPVFASAIAIGALTAPFVVRVRRSYYTLCLWVVAVQALVGLLGLYLHLAADFAGGGPFTLTRVIHGAPVFAPLLLPDMAVLAAIGLLELRRECSAPDPSAADRSDARHAGRPNDARAGH